MANRASRFYNGGRRYESPRPPGGFRMTKKSWTLLDLAADPLIDVSLAAVRLDSAALGLPGCSVQAKSLRGGLRDGVELLLLDNGSLRVAVLPQRGMGLWKAWLGEWAIGWNSPVHGPVHPRFVSIGEPSGLGWLDGFDELLCRCGLTSNGAPEFNARGQLQYPLHRRVANLPARRLEVEADPAADELNVTGVVDECRFHFQKLRLTSTLRMRRGETALRIVDEVTNLSGNPGEMQLLYHTNFGPPLLEPGATILAPVRRMMPRDARAATGLDGWNRYAVPQAGTEEEVYFAQLLADRDGWTHTLLRNEDGARGVSLRFAVAELPCFSLWKNSPPLADGYVTGLEPGVNFPNPRSFEAKQGRVRRLEPGETVRFELALEVHGDGAAVAAAEASIARLQQSAIPDMCQRPEADWTFG